MKLPRSHQIGSVKLRVGRDFIDVPIVISQLERRHNTADGLVALIDERIKAAVRVAYNNLWERGVVR